MSLFLQQVFFIALEVVEICGPKGFNVSAISAEEPDPLIELAIIAIKLVFQENGFRFLPKLDKSAFADKLILSLELI